MHHLVAGRLRCAGRRRCSGAQPPRLVTNLAKVLVCQAKFVPTVAAPTAVVVSYTTAASPPHLAASPSSSPPPPRKPVTKYKLKWDAMGQTSALASGSAASMLYSRHEVQTTTTSAAASHLSGVPCVKFQGECTTHLSATLSAVDRKLRWRRHPPWALLLWSGGRWTPQTRLPHSPAGRSQWGWAEETGAAVTVVEAVPAGALL